MKGFDELIDVIEDVARGEYSNAVLEYTRPEHPDEVQRLAEAVGMMMVKVEAREMHLTQLVEELQEANARIKENAAKTVIGMARALGTRDAYTKGHAERVAAYAERLARRIGLDEEAVYSIHLGGMLHDVGKIGFSDAIFSNTDTKPSAEMTEKIRQHPVHGACIVAPLDYLGGALEVVRFHHERMDGKGYPDGLEGDSIPLPARIVAVADCFDAITTTRSYQKAKPAHEGCATLRKLADSGGLDPALVELFIQDIEERGLENTEPPSSPLVSG